MRIPGNWIFCRDMLSRVAPADGSPFYAVEIGCASGGNAASMLRAFPNLQLYMVDPWRADPEYVAAMKVARPNSPFLAKCQLTQADFDRWCEEAWAATAFADRRVIIIRASSPLPTEFFRNGSLSFGFIDGDHREEAVAADLRWLWPKIRLGGIFAGHDYGTRGHDGVKRAVDAWASEEDVEIILDGKWPRCWRVEK